MSKREQKDRPKKYLTKSVRASMRAHDRFDALPNARAVRRWVGNKLSNKDMLAARTKFFGTLTLHQLIDYRIERYGGKVEYPTQQGKH